VAHLRTYLNIPNFDEMVAGVINTVTAARAEAKGVDGERFHVRVVPYKTADHSIRGAMIELVRHKGVLAKEEPSNG